MVPHLASEIDQNWPASNGCGAHATSSIDSEKVSLPAYTAELLLNSQLWLGLARVSGRQ